MANPALIGRYRFRNGVIYLLLSLWIAFSIFSFLWIIMTSIKSNKELYAGVWSLPGEASPWRTT